MAICSIDILSFVRRVAFKPSFFDNGSPSDPRLTFIHRHKIIIHVLILIHSLWKTRHFLLCRVSPRRLFCPTKQLSPTSRSRCYKTAISFRSRCFRISSVCSGMSLCYGTLVHMNWVSCFNEGYMDTDWRDFQASDNRSTLSQYSADYHQMFRFSCLVHSISVVTWLFDKKDQIGELVSDKINLGLHRFYASVGEDKQCWRFRLQTTLIVHNLTDWWFLWDSYFLFSWSAWFIPVDKYTLRPFPKSSMSFFRDEKSSPPGKKDIKPLMLDLGTHGPLSANFQNSRFR